MDTGVETWKIRLEKFQLSFYTSVYIDENAKQELIFDLLQVIFILFFTVFHVHILNSFNSMVEYDRRLRKPPLNSILRIV